MDNFLYETDVYSLEEFYKVVREMEEFFSVFDWLMVDCRILS